MFVIIGRNVARTADYAGGSTNGFVGAAKGKMQPFRDYRRINNYDR
jgi:hypothetical protein